MGTRTVDEYRKLKIVGEGTYGQVWKGEDRKTGRVVALKKIHLKEIKKQAQGMPLPALREIALLNRLHHHNIVEMLEIVTSAKTHIGGIKSSMYMVFEYLEHDLGGLIAAKYPFTKEEIPCFIVQLFRALKFLHSKNICHRDIKCSNLLIANNHLLKLTDFGLARELTQKNKDGRRAKYTNKVITLWYRPPELLLGETKYDFSIDIWSAGCVLLELLLGVPVFQGRNEMDQLKRIFKVCGYPDEDSWPGMRKLPLANSLNFKSSNYKDASIIEFMGKHHIAENAKSLTSRCRNKKSEQSDLNVERLLELNPRKRPSSSHCLESVYLRDSQEHYALPPIQVADDSLHEYEAKLKMKAAKERDRMEVEVSSRGNRPGRTSLKNQSKDSVNEREANERETKIRDSSASVKKRGEYKTSRKRQRSPARSSFSKETTKSHLPSKFQKEKRQKTYSASRSISPVRRRSRYSREHEHSTIQYLQKETPESVHQRAERRSYSERRDYAKREQSPKDTNGSRRSSTQSRNYRSKTQQRASPRSKSNYHESSSSGRRSQYESSESEIRRRRSRSVERRESRLNDHYDSQGTKSRRSALSRCREQAVSTSPRKETRNEADHSRRAFKTREMHIEMRNVNREADDYPLPLSKKSEMVGGNGIFVSNLARRTTKMDLEAFFSRCGDIKEIMILRNESAAIIEYKTYGEVKRAIRLLDGKVLNGYKISVSVDRKKPERLRMSMTSTRNKDNHEARKDTIKQEQLQRETVRKSLQQTNDNERKLKRLSKDNDPSVDEKLGNEREEGEITP